MSNLLVWLLHDNMRLLFHAETADLATVTCCDALDLIIEFQGERHVLSSNMSGCALQGLKQVLQSVACGEQSVGKFNDILMCKADRFGNVLLEMYRDSETLAFAMVTREIMVAWIKQIELLQILMEENENQKKSQTDSCCGRVHQQDEVVS